jgi:hypothetical protein
MIFQPRESPVLEFQGQTPTLGNRPTKNATYMKSSRISSESIARRSDEAIPICPCRFYRNWLIFGGVIDVFDVGGIYGWAVAKGGAFCPGNSSKFCRLSHLLLFVA